MKLHCAKFLGLLAVTLFAWQVSAADETSTQAQPKTKPPAKSTKPPAHEYPTVGSIERKEADLDKLIPADAKIELLAGGFTWAEGPVWVRNGKYLLFSDVPRNVVFKWEEGKRTAEHLLPSGYTGSTPRTGEPGSNGLTLDSKGRLVLAQHGDRQVARLDEKGRFAPLAQYFKLRRFNSPNDLAFMSNGDLYFTDPPYGLIGKNADPTKELFFNGVYRVTPNGEVTLLEKSLTFPNGIAFSSDEKTLYVAVSDPNNAVVMAYDVKADGTTANGRVFFDANALLKSGRQGLPDGLKVDVSGNVFATGPGGVLVISPDGKHLGSILTGDLTANCAWGGDGSVLYMTVNHTLCRIKTSTKGKLL